jgi:hypothetical protein
MISGLYGLGGEFRPTSLSETTCIDNVSYIEVVAHSGCIESIESTCSRRWAFINTHFWEPRILHNRAGRCCQVRGIAKKIRRLRRLANTYVARRWANHENRARYCNLSLYCTIEGVFVEFIYCTVGLWHLLHSMDRRVNKRRVVMLHYRTVLIDMLPTKKSAKNKTIAHTKNSLLNNTTV